LIGHICPDTKKLLALAVKKELTIHSLFYSYTLKKAVELFEWTGNSYHAEHYDEIRSKINIAVKSRCFDEDEGLYIDTPLKKLYSQHTNILAVLAGLDDDQTSKAIVSKVISDEDLLQVDMYFHFFLGRAINKAGLSDQYLTTIDPWKKFINLGMTTFGETVNEPRSECHAWSTGPAFEFLSTVCGVESSAPGFEKIKITPYLGELKEIKGAIAHPNGMINVELAKDRNGKLQGTIEIPDKTSGNFVHDGKVIQLQAGQPTLIR
jgi:alpha-L-rhamnosidase